MLLKSLLLMILKSGFTAHIERCGAQGCCLARDNIRRAKSFGLPLAKSCDRIAALNPCKQKHLVKISTITSI